MADELEVGDAVEVEFWQCTDDGWISVRVPGIVLSTDAESVDVDLKDQGRGTFPKEHVSGPFYRCAVRKEDADEGGRSG